MYICISILYVKQCSCWLWWNNETNSKAADIGEWLYIYELLKQGKAISIKPGKCADYVENKNVLKSEKNVQVTYTSGYLLENEI